MQKYQYKNIMPVPIALVRSFTNLSSFGPDSVAQAFLAALSSPKSDEKTANYDDDSSENHFQEDTARDPNASDDSKYQRRTPRDQSSVLPASVFRELAEETSSQNMENLPTMNLPSKNRQIIQKSSPSTNHGSQTLITSFIFSIYVARRKSKMWFTQSPTHLTSLIGNHQSSVSIWAQPMPKQNTLRTWMMMMLPLTVHFPSRIIT